MRIAYETTLDDHVELFTRMMRRQGTGLRYRRYVVLTVFVTCLLLFVFRASPVSAMVLVVACTGLMGLIAAPLLDRWLLRRRLIALASKQMGGKRTEPFAVEIQNDAMVLIGAGGIETRLPWAEVESLNETAGYIEIATRPQGMALVSTRAFRDQNDYAEFVAALKQHVAGAR